MIIPVKKTLNNAGHIDAKLIVFSEICQKTPAKSAVFYWLFLGEVDQFSFLGNRAPYEFIELDMSTVLDLSIPSSRPLTFPGGQSKNGYRARWLIELGDLSSSFFQEKKKREKMEIKAIMTTWSTKSKTPSLFPWLFHRSVGSCYHTIGKSFLLI